MSAFDDDEGLTPVKKMAMQVTFIVKHKSKLDSDPELWEIFFSDGKIMKIDTDHLNNSATFENLYLKLFGRPTPYIKRAEWKAFLRMITADDSKIQTIEAKSESEKEYIANQVFELICSMKADTDKEIAVRGQVLYDNPKNNCLCLTSSKVEEILQSRSYKIPLNDLSDAMTELGFKLPGTDAIRYKGKKIRSWHFIKTKVAEMQSSVDDDDNSVVKDVETKIIESEDLGTAIETEKIECENISNDIEAETETEENCV